MSPRDPALVRLNISLGSVPLTTDADDIAAALLSTDPLQYAADARHRPRAAPPVDPGRHLIVEISSARVAIRSDGARSAVTDATGMAAPVPVSAGPVVV